MNPIRVHPVSAGLVLAAVAVLGVSRAQQPQQAIRITPEQSAILSHMSIVYLDDGQGGQTKTIRFTGVNVQVVNGLGTTDTTNGVGNIIVGYNELGNQSQVGDVRTGSHNIAGGRHNSYGSYGGIVFGIHCAITGVCASVTSGVYNVATGAYSSITGGAHNLASGMFACVSGGGQNKAVGEEAWLGGGFQNQAIGYRSSISGGGANSAEAERATISGGFSNTASGPDSHICGGAHNVTTGLDSCVTGGQENIASGTGSCIVGGSANEAGGVWSVVSGGFGRTAPNQNDWVAGSLFEDN